MTVLQACGVYYCVAEMDRLLRLCCWFSSAQIDWNLRAVALHFPEVSAPHFIIKTPEDVAHMRVVGTYRSARGREGSPNGGDRTLAF